MNKSCGSSPTVKVVPAGREECTVPSALGGVERALYWHSCNGHVAILTGVRFEGNLIKGPLWTRGGWVSRPALE